MSNNVHQLTAINGSATELGYDAAGNETADPGNSALGVRRSATFNETNQVASILIKDTSDQTAIPYSYSRYLNDARRTDGGATFTRRTLA